MIGLASNAVRNAGTELNEEISPDSRGLAYESDDSGQFEIHLRPFPNVDSGHRQISTGGGTQPLPGAKRRDLEPGSIHVRIISPRQHEPLFTV
jgi:hypothetical protein